MKIDGAGKLTTWHNDTGKIDEEKVIGWEGLSGVMESMQQCGEMAGATEIGQEVHGAEWWVYAGKAKKNMDGQSKMAMDQQRLMHLSMKIEEIGGLLVIWGADSGRFLFCAAFHIAHHFLNNFHEVFLWKVSNGLQIFPCQLTPGLFIEASSLAIWNNNLPCWCIVFHHQSTVWYLYSIQELIELYVAMHD